MLNIKSAGVRIIAVAAVAVGIGFGAGVAAAGQPDMENALGALQSAQSSLQLIVQDKGGHASAAKRLVGEAIIQVQDGIAYGEAHGE